MQIEGGPDRLIVYITGMGGWQKSYNPKKLSVGHGKIQICSDFWN